MKAVRYTGNGNCRALLAVLKYFLLVWATAACLVGLAHSVAAQDAGQVTRFQRTAQYLQDAAPELRSDFAATALTSLARAYFAEARLAREESQSGQYASLRAWSATVERFASQMPLLLDDIELGLPVRLTLGAEKSLAITVADRTVILSHPRLYAQSAFEQEILVAFCARHNCEQFVPGSEDAVPIPVSALRIKPRWTFSSQESICAYDGLAVHFKGTDDMAKARFICEQFLQEVVSLANEMVWQHRHAVAIDWGQVLIQATPRRPEHVVQINALGDSVLVTVPMLYGSPELLHDVLPWIRQRVSNQQEAGISLDAERYGWQNP